ncbi:MAG: uroporphyrinogen decarboxylase family protein, partial [Candidatus Latescibacterota bacterium]
DLALHPAFVEELLECLAWGVRQTVELLVHGYAFEAIALSDDYGTQRGMLLSPDHWRRLIRPHLARLYALAHDHGRTVLHHSCGNVEPIVPDLVDLGLDILHPIQPEAMDVLRLKREYGRHLSFCGGVPTQRLLVGGTAAQVRAEVRRLKREMGAGGGYIVEPGITLQADVPLENMMAMIEEARAPARN